MAMNKPELKIPELSPTKKSIVGQLKNRIIVVVATPQEAQIAERYGASALIVIHTRLRDLAKTVIGGYGRAADPGVLRDVMNLVHLPIISRVRFGHAMEAKVAQACGVIAIDENHTIGKSSEYSVESKPKYTLPFLCCVKDLTEVLQRVSEGASILTTCLGPASKATATEDTPIIQSAARIYSEIYTKLDEMRVASQTKKEDYLKNHKYLLSTLEELIKHKRLPLPFFADGGIMMPTDVAMMMEIGFDGVIISNQVFFASQPEKRMRSLVLAMTHYKDPHKMAYIAEDVGGPGKAGTRF